MESSRMTTSRLCSTRRFAFSITISATCTWRAAGSSIVEENLVARLIRGLEVDRFNLDQREVLFTFVRRADLAANCVASLEVEFANLGGRDVDIVGAGQIVVVGRAEKAIAVGQNFQHAFGKNVGFFFALRLEDLEDQILLAQTAGPGQIQRSGDLGQLGYVFFFEFCDGHRFTCEEISVGGMRKRSTYFRGRAGGPVM